jgi:hypothetical protein
MHQSTLMTAVLQPADVAAPILEPSSDRIFTQPVVRLLLCFVIFVMLVAWAVIFRWSGDFDAVGHYLNVRDSADHPAEALYAWSRPMFVLLTVLPAKFGIIPVRMWMALLSCITAWLTMRLADRLKLPNATLAGPLLILQPLVFAIASDTMTEIPMALGVVIAIHLWWSRRWAWSALLISFLPMVRPEGFFIAPMWGIMLLADARGGSIARRMMRCCLLAVGICCWSLACRCITGDWLFFYGYWSWPVEGYLYYPHGTIFHHVFLWPYYCGGILTVLFLAGIKPSWNRWMALPWALWLLVFVVHSILFAEGWFASAGLMRIMASTSPVTALICLYGWNQIAQIQWMQRMPQFRRRLLGGAALAGALIWAIGSYLLYPPNWHTSTLCETAHYVRDNRLLDGAPRFFAADEIVRAEIDLGNGAPGVVKNIWSKPDELQMLSRLPIGSVGEWDNQRGIDFFQIDIPELLSRGYVVIHEVQRPILRWRRGNLGWMPERETQRYVILRKVADGAAAG